MLSQRSFGHESCIGGAGRHADGELGAAAVTGVDVERACGAILEAHRPRPCMQFEALYHVAVERSQGSKRAPAFDRVEWHVEKDIVQVHANSAIVGTAQGEARVVVIVRDAPPAWPRPFGKQKQDV